MNDTSLSLQFDRPPTRADYRRYQALVTDIGRDLQLAGRALYRLGGALKTIRDERLYRCGGYTTFQDFSAKELGLAREYIFRTIQAYDLLCGLITAGVPQLELPATERVCRELAALPIELRARVWSRRGGSPKNKANRPTVAMSKRQRHGSAARQKSKSARPASSSRNSKALPARCKLVFHRMRSPKVTAPD